MTKYENKFSGKVIGVAAVFSGYFLIDWFGFNAWTVLGWFLLLGGIASVTESVTEKIRYWIMPSNLKKIAEARSDLVFIENKIKDFDDRNVNRGLSDSQRNSNIMYSKNLKHEERRLSAKYKLLTQYC